MDERADCYPLDMRLVCVLVEVSTAQNLHVSTIAISGAVYETQTLVDACYNLLARSILATLPLQSRFESCLWHLQSETCYSDT